jgi:hypothetical protein
MSDKQPDWFSAGIGPGWTQLDDGTYRRVTKNPNGSSTIGCISFAFALAK